MGDKKKIFLAADNNFFTHLFVTIASILENCSNNKLIEILVFDGGISKQNKEKLVNYVKGKKSNLRLLEVDKKKYSDLKTLDHISQATFYRLEIPEIEKKDKVIYLDCDLVVLGNILDMFNLDLNNKTIGCVDDYLLNSKCIEDFNAGVLIIDCEMWNKKKYSAKIVKYLLKNGKNLKLCDQEVLNAILSSDFYKISPEWNRQRSIYDLTKRSMKLTKSQFSNLIKNPKIVHYVGSIKPWDYKYSFPDKKYYAYYLKKIGEKFNYKDKNLKGLMYKIIRWIIYKFKIINIIKKRTKLR